MFGVIGGILLISTGAQAAVEKFGCDNDRIVVAVEADRTAVEIKAGPSTGARDFRSHGFSTEKQTRVIGASQEAMLRLFVRKDHWGRVTLTARDGRILADELVLCNGPG